MTDAIQIEGLNQLVRQLKSLEPDLLVEYKALNRSLAETVLAEARATVPVRSGRLRDSLRIGVTQRAGIVRVGSSGVNYAKPIHFGWRRRNIEPQPFLYDALDRRRGEVLAAYVTGATAIVDRIR